MAVELNHTIVHVTDKAASARFYAEMLGVDPPAPFGHFLTVALSNNVTLDFLDARSVPAPQHYAFLVSEDDFDAIYGRIRERGLAHYADPMRSRSGEINRHDGGRGVYWDDPDGHLLEIITRPYGGG
ncbi:MULTISPECIES: VOC family protein [Actinomadura]|uniref:Predicted dioxygenase of extradiol dioxygenase family n=1 Tax=Actinomadura madurae TaxID=1993 RepID=A0A1I5F9J6_9ACTN|nr:VOC family protein [Actinomadura madurae]SFO20333.1 Predicted dioxygenase of extradiol dioxygenase family [Actinomadura madurae]SPT60281.1 Glutathione transferase fosA [Actinomadura madurae]